MKTGYGVREYRMNVLCYEKTIGNLTYDKIFISVIQSQLTYSDSMN